MTTALHLCTAEDAPVLTGLMDRFAKEHELPQTSETRAEAIAPLLSGHPYGMAYLFGPQRAPVGYLIATLSWSMDSGGLEATIPEFYLREAVRGRGLATEVLLTIARTLRQSDIRALHLDLPGDQDVEAFAKAGFGPPPMRPRLTRRL